MLCTAAWWCCIHDLTAGSLKGNEPPSHTALRAALNPQFLIGGDGPKRALLERIVAEHGLQGRVSLVGAVPHERVRQLLVRGHVFLNCSLTEAFCMALVEAAAAGGCWGIVGQGGRDAGRPNGLHIAWWDEVVFKQACSSCCAGMLA